MNTSKEQIIERLKNGEPAADVYNDISQSGVSQPATEKIGNGGTAEKLIDAPAREKTVDLTFSNKELGILRDVYFVRDAGARGSLEYIQSGRSDEYFYENNISKAGEIESAKKKIEDIKGDIKFLNSQKYPFDLTSKYDAEKFLNDLNVLGKTNIGRERMEYNVWTQDDWYRLFYKIDEWVDGKYGIMKNAGEIKPHKEVKANVNIAITEVVGKFPQFNDLKPMEAGILYNLKNNDDVADEVKYADGLKEQIYKKLLEKKYLDSDVIYKQIENASLTPKAWEFIDKVNARVTTRKQVKSGLDLFPEFSNIPELAMANRGGSAKEKNIFETDDFKNLLKASGYVYRNYYKSVEDFEKQYGFNPSSNKYFNITGTNLVGIIPEGKKLLDSYIEQKTLHKGLLTERFQIHELVNGGSTQKLYVDYTGGRFETWFYSEGDRHKGVITHDYDDVLRYKRKNDFTDIILTDEAFSRTRGVNGNSETDSDVLKPFMEIINSSDNFEDAFKKARQIKNIPIETANWFSDKYNPEGNLSMQQSFKKFYDEVKAGIFKMSNGGTASIQERPVNISFSKGTFSEKGLTKFQIKFLKDIEKQWLEDKLDQKNKLELLKPYAKTPQAEEALEALNYWEALNKPLDKKSAFHPVYLSDYLTGGGDFYLSVNVGNSYESKNVTPTTKLKNLLDKTTFIYDITPKNFLFHISREGDLYIQYQHLTGSRMIAANVIIDYKEGGDIGKGDYITYNKGILGKAIDRVTDECTLDGNKVIHTKDDEYFIEGKDLDVVKKYTPEKIHGGSTSPLLRRGAGGEAALEHFTRTNPEFLKQQELAHKYFKQKEKLITERNKKIAKNDFDLDEIDAQLKEAKEKMNAAHVQSRRLISEEMNRLKQTMNEGGSNSEPLTPNPELLTPHSEPLTPNSEHICFCSFSGYLETAHPDLNNKILGQEITPELQSELNNALEMYNGGKALSYDNAGKVQKIEDAELINLILKYGLSIRQIPKQIISTWIYSEKDIQEGDEIVEYVVKENVSIEKFEEGKKKLHWGDNFRLEDGKIYRRYIKRTTIPKNAGWWLSMVSPSNTSSSVHWSYKSDNLAPTLNESIALCIQKIQS